MHLPAVEELVVLERIELIARLGVCYESQPKDKDIALVWISELASQVKDEATEHANTIHSFV